MRILFFGTPALAVTHAEALAGHHELCGVVCQPDRPSERGHALHSPPVKLWANEHGIPVFQPQSFSAESTASLAAARPELSVVVAYGKLIPSSVIALAPRGCFNVHFSLLPCYRGAAPVQWALINGETETGITTFWLERALDSGPILIQKRVPIDGNDTAAMLFDRLIPAGVSAMIETVAGIQSGAITSGTPQMGTPSFAPQLKRSDGFIDWNHSSRMIHDRVRALVLWPGASTVFMRDDTLPVTIKLLAATDAGTDPESSGNEPGTIEDLVPGVGFMVRCGRGLVLVKEVQPHNGRRMSAWSFCSGYGVTAGSRLRSPSE